MLSNRFTTQIIRSGLLLSVLALNACGFSPLYGQQSRQANTGASLSYISVLPIKDRVGQMLHNELVRHFTPKGTQVSPLYDFRVDLSEGIAQLAVDQSSFATRANLRLFGQYTLVQRSNEATIISGTVNTVASYNILSSDFATQTAQANARKLAVIELAKLLRTRVAVHFKAQAPQQNRTSKKPFGQSSGQTNYGYPN